MLTQATDMSKLFSESGCKGEGKKLFTVASLNLFCILEIQTRKTHIVENLELNVW